MSLCLQLDDDIFLAHVAAGLQQKHAGAGANGSGGGDKAPERPVGTLAGQAMASRLARGSLAA